MDVTRVGVGMGGGGGGLLWRSCRRSGREGEGGVPAVTQAEE